MRELTTYDLDLELAEQLPPRELMSTWKPHNKCGCGGDEGGDGGDGGHNFALVQANVAVINVGDQSNSQSADGGDGGDA